MSLFLRFASFRCLVTTTVNIKRFYWTNHGFTLSDGLRIRYFIPKTSDTFDDSLTQRRKHPESVTNDFKVIYEFPNQKFLEGATFASLCFTVAIIYYIVYFEAIFESNEDAKKEEDDPTFEPAMKGEGSFGAQFKKNDARDYTFAKQIFSGNPKLKMAVALAMIIIFFYVRSKVVLAIYQNYNDFITVFYKPLGFKKKLIEHGAEDCYYFPNRKLFKHSILGKNVIIFPELFANGNENQFFFERKIH